MTARQVVGQIERQERRSEMKKNQTVRAHHSQAVTRVPDLTAADALVEEGLDIIATCLDALMPSAGRVPSAA
jgi:hypothetical protein